ncbi:MAG: hypothetical protein ACJ0KI_04710 [Dehalococcoidia bacterium]
MQRIEGQLYDVLSQEEISIAKLSSTNKEESARQYGLSFPRELPVGIRHLHFYWHKWARSRLDLQQCYEYGRTSGVLSTLRLVQLAHIIKQKTPQVVYEFGAGVSTVLIAQMIKSYGGKLISFEQSPKYYDQVQQNFPEELKDTAEIKLCPVRLDWFGDYRGIYYDFDAPPHIDFLYIDGATRTRGNPDSDFVYPRLNADIVRMNDAGTSIDYAVTDHRWANYLFYKEVLTQYSVNPSRWWKSIIINKR